jgi:hypothetical protein
MIADFWMPAMLDNKATTSATTEEVDMGPETNDKIAVTNDDNATTTTNTKPFTKKPKARRKVYRNLPASHFTNLTVLRHNDPIYKPGAWDGAPVVLEEYKLLFFTTPKVGCTVWKQLFRRVSGYADWTMQEDNTVENKNPKNLPHNPSKNGLTYLYHYPPSVADAMFTDPTWTRAIFVRDPKERLLSAYLDKAVKERKYMMQHCCPNVERKRKSKQSLKQAKMHQLLQCSTASAVELPHTLSLSEFVDTVVPACPDPHWNPQSAHISDNIWPTINFVGDMDRIETDATALLRQTGLWDEFGASGWGGDGGSIFHDTRSVHHATNSANRVREYYNTSALEEVVERLYRSDYENPILNLTRKRILLEEDRNERKRV